MPPLFSMPLLRPSPGTGYTDANQGQRLLVGARVRVVPGDTASHDGLALKLNGVTEASMDRLILAMAQGHVLFGYATRQTSAPPAGGPWPPLRAVLLLKEDLHYHRRWTRPASAPELTLDHPDTSLGQVSEAFVPLTFIEYTPLDFQATRQAVLELVRDALTHATDPGPAWTLATPVLRRGSTRGTPLSRWLPDETPEAFVDYLFGHARLNRLAPGGPDSTRMVNEGLRVSAGDAFARAAPAAATPPGSSTFNCDLTVRFLDGAKQSLNPCYLLNALVRGRERVTFVDDQRYADAMGGGGSPPNQLGIPALLAYVPTGSTLPSPLATRVHPLLWALCLDSHGVFHRVGGTGPLAPAPYPALHVASAHAPVYHPNYDVHRIDLAATGLGDFHLHRRRVDTSGPDFDAHPIVTACRDPADPALLRGSHYLWKLDENGSMVLRTHDAAPGAEDDFHAVFQDSDLRTVRQVWTEQGAHISRFSEMFGIPCEVFVGIAGKEGGADGNTAVGLEPWLPPPPDYVNVSPWSDRAKLETVPPEQLLADYGTAPGVKYLIMTHIWNPTALRWEASLRTRESGRFVQTGHLDLQLRVGRIVGSGRQSRFEPADPSTVPAAVRDWRGTYTWQELLADLDHFGTQDNAHTQPPEYRRSRPRGEASIPLARYRNQKRFSATLDQRISPGPTQNLITNVSSEDDILRALRGVNGTAGGDARLAELRAEGFFLQRHPYTDEERDILPTSGAAATPPSFRFVWLTDPAHNALITFVNWTNMRRRFHRTASGTDRRTLEGKVGAGSSAPEFTFWLEDEPLDPVIVVTFHGGMGDITRFDPATPFGILDDSPSQWRTFPPKYNACVHLFEQYEEFAAGRLVLPAVRFARRRP